MNIGEMLARNARMYAEEVALVERISAGRMRREITWHQFDKEANRIANVLLNKGIKKGDKVLHLMFNSIEWLAVYFGITRLGAWVVPLNFRYTSEDIIYCGRVSEAKMIIFGEEFAERIEAARPNLNSVKDYIIVGEGKELGFESLDELLTSVSARSPGVFVGAEDICGLYFTSGTTGSPKPLLLTHKNMECSAITNCVNDNKRHDDNFVFLSPLYHTGSKMRWFGNLIVGSRATMLTGANPKDIFSVMAEEKGTVLMMLVPWALDILVALEKGELKLGDYDLSRLRLVTLGAQPIPPNIVKRWKDWFPDIEIDIGYGISEATGAGSIHLGIENWKKAATTEGIQGAIIGKAGFNWETRIVSETGENVSAGKIGELLLRGDGIMNGYYKNPDKTAETLKDGWLFTGDLATMDQQGFIYLVDRKKDVIISGGENIYPVEVEEVLHGHPKIKDVAVIGLPDERLGEVVTAVIEPKPSMLLTEEDVMSFSEQNLPRYKRPRRIIFDRVPRNPTGKLEKPKLREKYAGTKTSFKV